METLQWSELFIKSVHDDENDNENEDDIDCSDCHDDDRDNNNGNENYCKTTFCQIVHYKQPEKGPKMVRKLSTDAIIGSSCDSLTQSLFDNENEEIQSNNLNNKSLSQYNNDSLETEDEIFNNWPKPELIVEEINIEFNPSDYQKITVNNKYNYLNMDSNKTLANSNDLLPLSFSKNYKHKSISTHDLVESIYDTDLLIEIRRLPNGIFHDFKRLRKFWIDHRPFLKKSFSTNDIHYLSCYEKMTDIKRRNSFILVKSLSLLSQFTESNLSLPEIDCEKNKKSNNMQHMLLPFDNFPMIERSASLDTIPKIKPNMQSGKLKRSKSYHDIDYTNLDEKITSSEIFTDGMFFNEGEPDNVVPQKRVCWADLQNIQDRHNVSIESVSINSVTSQLDCNKSKNSKYNAITQTSIPYFAVLAEYNNLYPSTFECLSTVRSELNIQREHTDNIDAEDVARLNDNENGSSLLTNLLPNDEIDKEEISKFNNDYTCKQNDNNDNDISLHDTLNETGDFSEQNLVNSFDDLSNNYNSESTYNTSFELDKHKETKLNDHKKHIDSLLSYTRKFNLDRNLSPLMMLKNANQIIGIFPKDKLELDPNESEIDMDIEQSEDSKEKNSVSIKLENSIQKESSLDDENENVEILDVPKITQLKFVKSKNFDGFEILDLSQIKYIEEKKNDIAENIQTVEKMQMDLVRTKNDNKKLQDKNEKVIEDNDFKSSSLSLVSKSSCETKDENVSTDDIDILYRDRKLILDMLSRENSQSRMQIELSEAHINYIIGQTDTLLEALENDDDEILHKHFLNYNNFDNDLNQSIMSTHSTDSSRSRARSLTRRSLRDRQAEIESFKLEKQKEDEKYLRKKYIPRHTRSVSPSYIYSRDPLTNGNGKAEIPNAPIIAESLTPKQRMKFLANKRRRLVKESKISEWKKNNELTINNNSSFGSNEFLQKEDNKLDIPIHSSTPRSSISIDDYTYKCGSDNDNNFRLKAVKNQTEKLLSMYRKARNDSQREILLARKALERNWNSGVVERNKKGQHSPISKVLNKYCKTDFNNASVKYKTKPYQQYLCDKDDNKLEKQKTVEMDLKTSIEKANEALARSMSTLEKIRKIKNITEDCDAIF